MQFEFATATRILFGPGRMAEAAPLVASMGRRPLIVTAKHLVHTQVFLEQMQARGLEPVTFIVPGEPEVGRDPDIAALLRHSGITAAAAGESGTGPGARAEG